MENEIDGYIKKKKSPQKEICRRLRKIIKETFPGINEGMKLGVPWYEDYFYFVGLRDHVNLGFSVKGLTKSEMDNFEGKGKLMRHLKFFLLDEIDEKKVVRLLKLVKRKAKCKEC